MLRFSFPDERRAENCANILRFHIRKYCKISVCPGGHFKNGFAVYVSSDFPEWGSAKNGMIDCRYLGTEDSLFICRKTFSEHLSFGEDMYTPFKQWTIMKELEELAE